MTTTELINYWIEEIKNNNKFYKDSEFKNVEIIPHNKNTLWLKANIDNENKYFYCKILRGKIKFYIGSIYSCNESSYQEEKYFI